MIGHTYLEGGKYFIPDIEDFCIGYECEVCWAAGYTTDFDPYQVRLKNDEFIYVNDLEHLCIAADDGYAYIRTKCLDKEDIESLGWKYNSVELSNDLHFTLELNDTVFDLAFYGFSKWIYISVGAPSYRMAYYGKCPSKNELIKIMKLLGI